MDMNSLVLVSVDDHCVEPANVFDGRMPARYADRAPRIVEKDGNQIWVFEGESASYLGLNAVAGRPPDEWGLNPTRYDEMRRACWDIDERVRDMSADGLLAQLCFPTFPQFCGQYFNRQKDKDLVVATIRAYNDWNIEVWAGSHPGRQIPCALVPLWDAELAAKEIRRVALMGCHSVAFSENPYKLGYPSLHSDHWEPFFAACADEATVICTHLGSSSEIPVTSPDAPMDVSVVLVPTTLQHTAVDIVWSGVFGRYPSLKWALSEGGIGWVPYILERMDYTYKRHSCWTGSNFGGKLPSEVFREHVITCFIEDHAGIENRHHMNLDFICLESDYPHSDSSWPRTPEQVAEFMAPLDPTEVDKITHLNALRHFQFDPFAHIPRDQATVGALRASVRDLDLTFADGRVPLAAGKGNVVGSQYQKIDQAGA